MRRGRAVRWCVAVALAVSACSDDGTPVVAGGAGSSVATTTSQPRPNVTDEVTAEVAAATTPATEPPPKSPPPRTAEPLPPPPTEPPPTSEPPGSTQPPDTSVSTTTGPPGEVRPSYRAQLTDTDTADGSDDASGVAYIWRGPTWTAEVTVRGAQPDRQHVFGVVFADNAGSPLQTVCEFRTSPDGNGGCAGTIPEPVGEPGNVFVGAYDPSSNGYRSALSGDFAPA